MVGVFVLKLTINKIIYYIGLRYQACKTKRMSPQEKMDILIKAKTKSKSILIKNGLITPFDIIPEGRKKTDSSFRTIGKYRGFYNGKIIIVIKCHLLWNNLDVIIDTILHEYSHYIYDRILFSHDAFKLVILLEKYFTKLPYDLVQDELLHESEKKQEQFCDFFSLYLTEQLNHYLNLNFEEMGEIENCCTKIINGIHGKSIN